MVAFIAEFIGTTTFLFFAFGGTVTANIGAGSTANDTTTQSNTGFNPSTLLRSIHLLLLRIQFDGQCLGILPNFRWTVQPCGDASLDPEWGRCTYPSCSAADCTAQWSLFCSISHLRHAPGSIQRADNTRRRNDPPSRSFHRNCLYCYAGLYHHHACLGETPNNCHRTSWHWPFSLHRRARSSILHWRLVKSSSQFRTSSSGPRLFKQSLDILGWTSY